MVAVVAAAVALLLRAGPAAFGPSFDPILLLVVAFSTWYGGFGPGMVTLVLVGLGARVLIAPPLGSFGVASESDPAALVVYGVAGLVVSGLIASLLPRAGGRSVPRPGPSDSTP